MLENKRKQSITKKVSLEIGKELLNLVFGNIYNKTGFSVLLFILGLICIFSPIKNEPQKPIGFYIVGGLLILSSIILISKRYNELKQNIKKPNA
jgi:hypothetical protein